MLQIRSVRDALHRNLKSRAAAQGVALSDYAPAILRREESRPTREEMLERFAALSSVKTKEKAATIINRGRPRRWSSSTPPAPSS